MEKIILIIILTYICDGNPASTKNIRPYCKKFIKKPLYFYVNKKLFKIIGVIFKKRRNFK